MSPTPTFVDAWLPEGRQLRGLPEQEAIAIIAAKLGVEPEKLDRGRRPGLRGIDLEREALGRGRVE